MILALLACVPVIDDLCAPGTIVLGSSGEAYQRLESALAAADYTDAICIGEGHWEVDELLQLDGDEGEEGRWIDVFGAGSDRTTLHSSTLNRFELRFDMGTGATHASLRGITLENIGALLIAGEVEITDVVSRSDGLDAGLVVHGYSVVAADVEATGHRWMHQDGLALRARDTLVVEGLVVEDNESNANFPVVLDGRGGLTWTGGALLRNTSGAGLTTDRFLTTGCCATVTGLEVRDNELAGSLLAADADVSFVDVDVRDNVAGGDHLIWGAGASWTMVGGRVTDNQATVSSLGVYGDGTLTLDGMNLSNPETPCEVAGGTACLPVASGTSVSTVCTSEACTAQD